MPHELYGKSLWRKQRMLQVRSQAFRNDSHHNDADNGEGILFIDG